MYINFVTLIKERLPLHLLLQIISTKHKLNLEIPDKKSVFTCRWAYKEGLIFKGAYNQLKFLTDPNSTSSRANGLRVSANGYAYPSKGLMLTANGYMSLSNVCTLRFNGLMLMSNGHWATASNG